MPNPFPTAGWRIHADRGGTFTDLVGIAPDGTRHTQKLLSHAPARYDDAVLAGTRALLGLPPDAAIAEGAVTELRLGTTVTTNALLEGRQAPCALITNSGFEDLLAIGDQSRPDIFALAIPPRQQLCREVHGVTARRGADGALLVPLDESVLRTVLAELREDGVDSLAVALLHGAQYPQEEQRIAAMAREAGFAHCCCSHEVSPEPGLLDRAQTAVVEAALIPVLASYTRDLAAALPGTRIRFMQSDGRLAEAAHLAARNSIFSGPAGGVIGAGSVARAAGLDALIGLDMGGTSTDVFESRGDAPVRDAATVAGQVVRAPALDLQTVAAGGGSRVFHDGRRMRVGPESAGAEPGPACYGRGGSGTVTDANLLLGRLDTTNFAPVFGPNGDTPLDTQAAAAAFDALACCDGSETKRFEAARGALQLANEHMAAAVRRISVARGVDIADHTLVAFGGAGAQHACDVAEALGLRSVLVPAQASVLSAVGVGLAAVGVTKETAIDALLDDTAVARAHDALPRLRAEAERQLAEQDSALAVAEAELRLHYTRGDTVIELSFNESSDAESLAADFARAHEQRYGFADASRPIHVAALRMRAREHGAEAPGDGPSEVTLRDGTQPMMHLADGRWRDVPVLTALGTDPVEGPALVRLAQSSFVLAPGWRAWRDTQGIRAERVTAAAVDIADSAAARLELFNARFMHIASEMGEALRRSAQSVNVRNRLDYSCAIFDAEGRLIANAPHIPVHLGSMSASVQAVRPLHGDHPVPGEAWLINDPYSGGTHLPDLTLVMPVSLEDSGTVSAYVAARAHHADIGGISPGSMPADSRNIEEEGIRFTGLRAASGGRLHEATLHAALAKGQWPARDPVANLADLRAQLAACTRGVRLLEVLAADTGVALIHEQMQAVRDYSAGAVADFIAGLAPGAHHVILDDGQEVALELSVAKGRLRLDFSASSGVDAGNTNAPRPVLRAAVMYALRCVMAQPLPLNDGFLEAVDLIVTPGSLLNPRPPAAVVAGNVETSQAITDALMMALGAMAESQGTMNNISFGNARFQYYETLAGGSGAGPDFDGADAVHSHMTNSRITDPEILERQMPLRVRCFAIRRGSGGGGRHRGGDGLVRELELLEAVDLAIISNRRCRGARGAESGGNGLPGENLLLLPDGHRDTLPGRARREVPAGSRLCIATPGGGGWGEQDGD
jgi:5-oxoprolinase (ATP-hydrolysing)